MGSIRGVAGVPVLVMSRVIFYTMLLHVLSWIVAGLHVVRDWRVHGVCSLGLSRVGNDLSIRVNELLSSSMGHVVALVERDTAAIFSGRWDM